MSVLNALFCQGGVKRLDGHFTPYTPNYLAIFLINSDYFFDFREG